MASCGAPVQRRGAGVSLVISPCLADGIECEALADAAFGRDDPISWPAAASRRRWQALREDARQTAREIPAIRRAFVAALGLAGVATVVPELLPGCVSRHLCSPLGPTNPTRSQRQRSSSMPTSGRPAHIHSAGRATRCLLDWRPASPNEWDGSPQTATTRRRKATTVLPFSPKRAQHKQPGS